jgi:hypothetical protein
VKKSKMPSVGHAVSKWHGKLLATLGPLSSDRLTVHSYRHTVGSRLHALEVPHVVNLAIMGHGGRGVNVTAYPDQSIGHAQENTWIESCCLVSRDGDYAAVAKALLVK